MYALPGDGDRPLLLERLTSQVVHWLPRRTVLILSGTAITAVGFLDYGIATLAGYDFVVTPFYLLAVGFAAWAAGARVGSLFALYASAVELVAMWAASEGRLRAWIVFLSCTLELVVFLGGAYTIARLRWHLAYERQLSHTDPVTGIGNLRTFEEAALREISRSQRRPGPLSVAYFDVDHFKDVNDQRGHSDGDLLLRVVGAALRGAVRSMDTVARVGGDEFVVLLPETDSATCRLVVDRLRTLLNESVTRAGFENTFSVGVVTFESAPQTAAELLSRSDKVMYAVKRGPRNGARYEVVAATGA
jgi:diguanylate cyclase (GGDEF)-like protein